MIYIYCQYEYDRKEKVKIFVTGSNAELLSSEISSLTKQLQLMFNIFDHYISEVPMEYWKILFDTLQSHEATLRNSIMNEEGPFKKEKCRKCAELSIVSS